MCVCLKIEYSSVLVRFGEIGIKSKQTRRRMTQYLVNHLRSALEEQNIPFSNIRNDYSRIFIETKDTTHSAAIAARVFGVVSVSPVVTTSADIEQILQMGEYLAKITLNKGTSFAARARRIGTHDYTSQELAGLLGERILDNNPNLELSVDLNNPNHTIYVEVRDEIAYIFTEIIQGVGGMPTGSQGKVICTVSTGLDSPIAAYKIMKRGAIPIFVYFDNSPHCDSRCTEIAIKQAQVLANYIYNFDVKMYIVSHWLDLEDAIKHGPERMTCLFCKRNMMRLAREIAIIEGADAIVTGEIIGEQASQTTANLRVIDEVISDFPILRPLAGDDKVDIERIAQEIGTYVFAEERIECCNLAPRYPAVNSTVQKAIDAEQTMDHTVLQSEIADAKVIFLRRKSN